MSSDTTELIAEAKAWIADDPDEHDTEHAEESRQHRGDLLGGVQCRRHQRTGSFHAAAKVSGPIFPSTFAPMRRWK